MKPVNFATFIFYLDRTSAAQQLLQADFFPAWKGGKRIHRASTSHLDDFHRSDS